MNSFKFFIMSAASFAPPVKLIKLVSIASKSAADFTAAKPRPAMGIVNDRVIDCPSLLVFLPKVCILRIDWPSALSKLRVLAPMVTIRSFSFAIRRVPLFVQIVVPWLNYPCCVLVSPTETA